MKSLEEVDYVAGIEKHRHCDVFLSSINKIEPGGSHITRTTTRVSSRQWVCPRERREEAGSPKCIATY